MPILTPEAAAKAVDAEIAKTNNVGAILEILRAHYKVEAVELNFINKAVFVSGLKTIINNLKPPVR